MKFTETYLSPNSPSEERSEQINRILMPIKASLEEKMASAFSTDEERQAAKVAIVVCMEAFKQFMEFRMERGETY